MFNLFSKWYESVTILTGEDGVSAMNILTFVMWTVVLLMVIGVFVAILNLIFKCLFGAKQICSKPEDAHDHITVINNLQDGIASDCSLNTTEASASKESLNTDCTDCTETTEDCAETTTNKEEAGNKKKSRKNKNKKRAEEKVHRKDDEV